MPGVWKADGLFLIQAVEGSCHKSFPTVRVSGRVVDSSSRPIWRWRVEDSSEWQGGTEPFKRRWCETLKRTIQMTEGPGKPGAEGWRMEEKNERRNSKTTKVKGEAKHKPKKKR